MLFFYGHYFIALGAVASFGQVYMLTKSAGAFWVPCGLIFFATLGLYNLHSLVGLQLLKKVPDGHSPRLDAMQQREWLIWLNLGLAAAGGGICLYWWGDGLLLLPPLLLGGWYVLPVGGGRLRDFGSLKVALLAAVWAWVVAIVPLGLGAWPEFIGVWWYIFALTLPFDVRDMALDELEKVQTLAQVWGAKWTIISSGLLLLGWGLFWGWYYGRGILLLGGGLSAAAVLGLRAWRAAPDWYFSVVLDGLIIVVALLVYASG